VKKIVCEQFNRMLISFSILNIKLEFEGKLHTDKGPIAVNGIGVEVLRMCKTTTARIGRKQKTRGQLKRK